MVTKMSNHNTSNDPSQTASTSQNQDTSTERAASLTWIVQPKSAKIAVTHQLVADAKLKRSVLEHVLLTRDARRVPEPSSLPSWSDDDLYDNYFTKRPGDTATVDVVMEQRGELNLIDIGHHGVRITLTTAEKGYHATNMRANASFKKFELLCQSKNSLGASASIYMLANTNLKQMSLILEDAKCGKMWLFDQVHTNVDALITQMYDRLYKWLHHYHFVPNSVYLTIQYKSIDDQPSSSSHVEAPKASSLLDHDVDHQ